MAASIFSRKLDFVYLLFFAIHIPIVLVVDTYPLWPAAQVLPFMTSLRQFYITTYKDNFFIAPPSWFYFYTWMEAIYHLPLSLWAIYGLLTDSHLVPLHLVIYAVQTGVTTATCISEALSWSALTAAEKGSLMGLYVPYLGVSVLMGIDMFLRLSKVLRDHAAREQQSKLK